MTIHVKELLREALACPIYGDETWLDGAVLAMRVAQAYLSNNPPWKDRAVLWLCRRCAHVNEKSLAGKAYPFKEGEERRCDLCGEAQSQKGGVLVAALADLK